MADPTFPLGFVPGMPLVSPTQPAPQYGPGKLVPGVTPGNPAQAISAAVTPVWSARTDVPVTPQGPPAPALYAGGSPATPKALLAQPPNGVSRPDLTPTPPPLSVIASPPSPGVGFVQPASAAPAVTPAGTPLPAHPMTPTPAAALGPVGGAALTPQTIHAVTVHGPGGVATHYMPDQNGGLQRVSGIGGMPGAPGPGGNLSWQQLQTLSGVLQAAHHTPQENLMHNMIAPLDAERDARLAEINVSNMPEDQKAQARTAIYSRHAQNAMKVLLEFNSQLQLLQGVNGGFGGGMIP